MSACPEVAHFHVCTDCRRAIADHATRRCGCVVDEAVARIDWLSTAERAAFDVKGRRFIVLVRRSGGQVVSGEASPLNGLAKRHDTYWVTEVWPDVERPPLHVVGTNDTRDGARRAGVAYLMDRYGWTP